MKDVRLDELRGLRVTIAGHDGEWPISTVKFAEVEYDQAAAHYPKATG